MKTSKKTTAKKTVTKKPVLKAKGGAKKAVKAKKATKVVKPVKKVTGGAKTESKNRYFKVVVDGGEAFGRFSGSKPKQAANKALTSLLRKRKENKKNTNVKLHYSIVECTRGSKRKEYKYVGNRKKLDNPVKVEIRGKEVTYKYMNTVRKDKTLKKA